MPAIFRRIISAVLAVCLAVSAFFVTPARAAGGSPPPGTFRCAWFDETLTYPYTYSDSLFDASSRAYNHDLATFSLCLAMASFNSFDPENRDEHIRALLTECGYSVSSFGYDTGGYDTVGLEVGVKRLKGFTAVIAVVRSGNYGLEWGGNMRIGTEGSHSGFDTAKNLVLGYLNEFFAGNRPEGKIKLLIPGYSRGASIANLVCAELDSGSYVSRLGDSPDSIRMKEGIELFCYTFEAPQCTTDADAHSAVYSNIFNVINPNDYVPLFVMSDWGFTHYGVRVELPCADNTDDYDSYYLNVCREFDSFMGVNNKKSSSCFYDSEDSRSCEATLNYIFSALGSDVMKSREYYAGHYENPLIFFAGQYLSQNRKFKDFMKTLGLAGIAACVCISPRNLAKIKSDGYRKYLAGYIAENNTQGELSDRDIDCTIDLLISLLDFISENSKDISSLLSQLKTVIYVHQPYVSLAWMRSVSESDVRCINMSIDSGIRLNCTSLTLRYNTNGKLNVYYAPSAGTVTFRSSAPKIVTVDDEGNLHTVYKGNAVITAALTDKNGNVVSTATVDVTVKMNLLQRFLYALY